MGDYLMDAVATTSAHIARDTPGISTAARNGALDFTKGALVLLMILYHWTNYFVRLDDGFYRYLRFITPSFIFITGFLIANIYLARYQIGDPRLHFRLLERGLKLLVLFTVLNVCATLVLGRGLNEFVQNAGATYVSGNGKTAAFSVLVPISYVLIVSSVLLIPCKWSKSFLPTICAVFFLAILVLHLNGVGSGNLELFAVGFLGMTFGLLPIQRIDQFAGYRLLIAVLYIIYLAALTMWHEIYPLQVIGVCLTLLVIYSVGLKIAGFPQSWVILLGKYTLLGYVAQIAVLVSLAMVIRRLPLGTSSRLVISFVGAFGLTYAIILALDRLRSRWSPVDRMYKFVFA